MSAVIYHPETQATVVVPPEAVPHYRLSGWLLLSEWEANQAQAAEAEAAAKQAKPSKSEEK